MPINNFSVADIVDRIFLVLPDKFVKDENSNIYSFFDGVAEALNLTTNQLDELYRQTNLVSSSGSYVDDYITDLTNIGRKFGETDANYKQRYYNNVFKYNCTRNGIKAIVIDLTGSEPFAMYESGKRGAYTDARQYYNDDSFISTYGNDSPDAFVAYIQFSTKPFASDAAKFNELCKTISSCAASGVRVYLYYPQ